VSDTTGQTIKTPRVSGAWLRRAGVAGIALSLALGSEACRTNSDNVEHWAKTVQGPKKLVAVLTHDKYPVELRVEAALALIRMKPRNGRRIGIDGSDDQPGLMAALTQLPPATRSAIITRLVPALEAEIQKPPPAAQGGQIAPDPSVPYKDAAFAMLTTDGGRLLNDPALRARMRAAIARWISVSFPQRFDDSSQSYSVKQMVGELKTDSVKALPNLIQPGAAKIDALAELISDQGDPATKLAASQRLVAVASDVASEGWVKQKSPGVEAANKAQKLAPTAEQFKAQMAQYQEEELLRVFASMKRIGQAPVVDFLLRFAQDKNQTAKSRAGAIAALQGNLDRTSAPQAEAILAVAGAPDTPDQVRDAALQRVGEFPRQVVVERLYALFSSPAWKVRWVAAELILKMSDTSQLPEFMEKIGKAEGMAITEPLRYGSLIGDMKGPKKPVEVIAPFLNTTRPVASRLTALGYYYEKGTKAEIGKLSYLEGDHAKTPTCAKDADGCEWKCEVAGEGKRETKDIGTVGEFFNYCVKPAMEKRTLP
jgi:HEAT repeat protein